MGRLSPRVAMVVDTLSQCEPLAVEVLCDVARRRDLAAAEQMGLVSIERTGARVDGQAGAPAVRRAAPRQRRRAVSVGIRGRLATRLAEEGDADMQATVRRALLRLESDLDPDPELYLESARHAMTLLDLDLADRFATAATQAGAPGAAGVRAMNLALLGRGEPAEAALRDMADSDMPDGHHWATVRAANLIWHLFNPQAAAEVLDGLAAASPRPRRNGGAVGGAGMPGRGGGALCVRGRECPGRIGFPGAAGLSRDDGVTGVDHGDGGAGAGRRARRRGRAGAAARDDVVSGVAYAVLVRGRLRARLPADRSYR